ncbi:unnamed protein product [Rotaria sp. Silwood1]|nr:unnamed protein product [Rotaria sp. Silwood1]CAF1381598.1 unnamed protein product [Rotaria sp. Silwood1]CAF1384708.1 unnamed protein product [Rotaria sp. Silwood1]CAF3542771.1 unnamed protein product [Rotaria sp. Silwood1]CAF3583679.1 unnamed protein product [Rotaria sp. Silwood1]
MASSVQPTDNFHTNADEMNLDMFRLIWLDANTNVADARSTEQKLLSIINQLKKLRDVEECQKYIEERSKSDRLIMIVSGSLGRKIVPSIHRFRQAISIYVYCMDEEGNKKWVDRYPKVKAVAAELDELISQIKKDHKIQKTIEESLSINYFTRNSDPGKSTADLNGKFVFSQVLIDCLLRLKTNKKDIQELINRCKQQYNGNSVNIDYRQALSFLNAPDDTDNFKSVLFEIDANPTVATMKPFADISNYSEFPGDSEILFMLGSIFRLVNIEYNSDDQVWIIQMTLCSENEHDLEEVRMHITQQLGDGETNLQTLGKVLWEMGKPDLAEKYFMRFLEQLPPNAPLLVSLFEDLGKLASQNHQYDKSVQWHQKAIAFKKVNQSIASLNTNKIINSNSMFN